MLVDPKAEHVKSGVIWVHLYFLVDYALTSKIYFIFKVIN